MLRKEEAHVVILGGGFAGLAAARALNVPGVRITLIDRSNHHLFQPLLYQVATAALAAPDVSTPIRQLLWQAAQRDRADGQRAAHRGGEETHPARGPLRRLRLPRARDGDDPRVLRQRQVGGARARPQDHRRSAGHPPPHPARVRGGGAGDHDRGAARVDDVRRHRRRPDRRRAGGGDGGDRGAHARARLSPLRSANDARDPDRGRPARAGQLPGGAVAQGARPARGAGGRGANRHARDRSGEGLRRDRRRVHHRAHRAVGGGRARQPARDTSGRPDRSRRADLGRRRSRRCPIAARCSSPAI